MLAAAGTRWDPTIGPVIGYSQLLQERLPSSGYERLRSFFPNVNEQVEAFRPNSWKMKRLPVILAQQLATVRAAYSHGVQIHAGTDAPAPDGHLAFPGPSLHWELDYLTQAGEAEGIRPRGRIKGIRDLEAQAVDRVGERDVAEAAAAGDQGPRGL